MTRRSGLRLWSCCAVLLVAARIGLPGLSDPSEARYAQIAREMEESGDWVVPRLQGVVHLEKPPLAYWSAAAGIRLLGRSEFSVRLGAALALLLTAVLAGSMAQALVGPEAGLPAAVATALSPYPLAVGAACLTDPFVLLGATLFHHSVLRRIRSGDRRALSAAVVGLAIGFLAKGHVILLFTVLPLAFARTGILRELLRPFHLFLLGILTVPWVVAVQVRYPDFLHEHGVKLLDFLGPGRQHHRAPFPIYVGVLAVGLFPLPLFAWNGFRRLAPPTRRLLAAWIVLPLLVLTLVRSRSWTYILPAVPPLAVLSVAGLVSRRSPARSLTLLGVLGVVAAAVLVVCSSVFGAPLLWLAAALGACGAQAIARRRAKPLTVCLGVIGIASACLVGASLFQQDAFKIHRELARRTMQVAGSERPVVVITPNVFSIGFYADRPVTLVGGSYRLQCEADRWGWGRRYRPQSEASRILKEDHDSVIVVDSGTHQALAPQRAVRFRQRNMLLLDEAGPPVTSDPGTQRRAGDW